MGKKKCTTQVLVPVSLSYREHDTILLSIEQKGICPGVDMHDQSACSSLKLEIHVHVYVYSIHVHTRTCTFHAYVYRSIIMVHTHRHNI